VLGGNHLRSLLANHDRGRIRVSGDYRRHDAGVRHAQAADATHLQTRVDNAADPAGRGRVVHGQREVQRKLFEQLRELLPAENEPSEKGILGKVKDYFM